MWAWFADPGNQKTLGFLGGGVAAFAGAAWAVFKFFLNKPRRVTTITADRGGMAAGRDINAAPQPPATGRRR
jgi:hypothetical protein